VHPRVEHLKARVRCPECRTHFHERVHRIVRGDTVTCPSCQNDMRFRHMPHWHDGEDEMAYLHRVEGRTAHPHYHCD
jgi:endogenous inhibitor of DNA gyrase (YacG/DUF329 family)